MQYDVEEERQQSPTQIQLAEVSPNYGESSSISDVETDLFIGPPKSRSKLLYFHLRFIVINDLINLLFLLN